MDSEYIFDYRMLRGRIKEVIGAERNLAKEIGISKTAMSNKLNNRSFFNPVEIIKIKELLDIPDKEVSIYFFNQKIRKTERDVQTVH
ncbi:DUF739 family protein [Vagococcus carniphilus]|uniref:DUF739 family protein n=1 Tax=Vagococcus carniphilus TaxID=218144 RepID=UPI002891301F|nr:DUF739 family protein [Vagococcus carniphilus]MDT2850196.1 DUF739 family protein [Vagococcus carniphilus]